MKKYKLTTIILTIVVLIQTTMLTIEFGRSRVAEVSPSELEYLLGSTKTKSNESSLQTIIKNGSNYISVKTALESLAKFKKRQGVFYRVKKRAYGHYYDLEVLRKYLGRIDDFNTKINDTTKVINGIRIYRSRNDYKKKPVFDNRGNPKDSIAIKYDDLFLIPTYGDMKNLYKIDADYDKKSFNLDEYYQKLVTTFMETFQNQNYLDDESLILNASIPCPNNCNQN